MSNPIYWWEYAALDIQKMLVAAGRRWREKQDPSTPEALREIEETVLDLLGDVSRDSVQIETASIMMLVDEPYGPFGEKHVTCYLAVQDNAGWPHRAA